MKRINTMAVTTVEVNMLDGDLTVTSVGVGGLEREHYGPTLQCFLMNQVEAIVSVNSDHGGDSPDSITGEAGVEVALSCLLMCVFWQCKVYRVTNTTAHNKS